MTKLTEQERDELIDLLQAGEPIPTHWRGKLFADGPQSVEIGKEAPCSGRWIASTPA